MFEREWGFQAIIYHSTFQLVNFVKEHGSAKWWRYKLENVSSHVDTFIFYSLLVSPIMTRGAFSQLFNWKLQKLFAWNGKTFSHSFQTGNFIGTSKNMCDSGRRQQWKWQFCANGVVTCIPTNSIAKVEYLQRLPVCSEKFLFKLHVLFVMQFQPTELKIEIKEMITKDNMHWLINKFPQLGS